MRLTDQWSILHIKSQHNQLTKHNENIPMPPGTLKATTPIFLFH